MVEPLSPSVHAPSNPRTGVWCVLLLAACNAAATAQTPPESLESRLRAEDASALVRTARIDGDARRGAVLFHGPALGCSKCHVSGSTQPQVGPDLSKPTAASPIEEIVASILDPSAKVEKEYQGVTLALRDGRVISGVRPVVENQILTLLDAAQPGTSLKIPLDEIAERRDGGPSVMPAGLVNGLASRGDFLDLLRYLVEIREGGPQRARMLKPSAFELAPPPLPAYESNLDHARLLSALDEKSLVRGREIYQRVCASCHGAPGHEGSMPTSPKFWDDRLKCEGDPLRMYQTITRGQGLMPPHPWLVPRQKYDVIYYIREQFFKSRNASQYKLVDEAYLAALPAGVEVGPDPAAIEPWAAMDYGPALAASYEIGRDSGLFAYKGIAVRLDEGPGGVAAGGQWAVYDHDTMNLVGAWEGQGFIDWRSIIFNGEHEIHPATVGRVLFRNTPGPAWANPSEGGFDDPRLPGRDGKRYGPLPRDWLSYRGHYIHGDRVVLSYTVGSVSVLDSATLAPNPGSLPLIVRSLEIGPAQTDLALRIGPARVGTALTSKPRVRTREHAGFRWLDIPARPTTALVRLIITTESGPAAEAAMTKALGAPESLESLTQGGPRRWSETLTTSAERFDDEGPFGIDVFTLPDANPWNAQIRPTGFDFLDDDSAAVCTWDGDVWTVSGISRVDGRLTWRRIASGLFQPLGLKIIDGAIYVGCRDQITILRDLNGDGETDYYQCFNSDHQVTEHFHEFAMGLQTDAEGNLLYAKAARHGKEAVVPQHGTLLRVSAHGSKTEILARGFRAPNGVCVNADGTFFVTDQEGHWIPKNRLNWINDLKGFYGNMWAYSDVTDTSDAAMRQPVCWLTNTFDRSPAEPLWVTSEKWRGLNGSLLSLSYGYGQVYVAPHEKVGDMLQGGMVALPLPRFPTGLIRGRFHAADKQLYVCGMYSWAGSQTRPGGFFRIRATGKPAHVPVEVHAAEGGLRLKFSDPLDASSVNDISHFGYRSWSIERTRNYGSPHRDEREHKILSARLEDDRRTVEIRIEALAPTPCYELWYELLGSDGSPVSGALNGTLHSLQP